MVEIVASSPEPVVSDNPAWLGNWPDREWTDLEWDAWFEYKKVMREKKRALRREEFVEALKAHKYLIEYYRTDRPGKFTVWPNAWQKTLEAGRTTIEKIAEHVENRENGFGWKVVISDHVPYVHKTGLTRLTVIDALRMKGYTHMKTFAGPIPLDEWTPYGHGGSEPDTIRFELRDDDSVADHVQEDEIGDTVRSNLILGLWTPLKI
jgi:hypothetical protein